jgi:hypothetical protein
MARASGSRLVFDASACRRSRAPSSSPRRGIETGWRRPQRRFVAPHLTVADGVPPERVALAHDPQTSEACSPRFPADGIARCAGTGCGGRRALVVGRVERRQPTGRSARVIVALIPAHDGGARIEAVVGRPSRI